MNLAGILILNNLFSSPVTKEEIEIINEESAKLSANNAKAGSEALDPNGENK